jgi:hypothetical protein
VTGVAVVAPVSVWHLMTGMRVGPFHVRLIVAHIPSLWRVHAIGRQQWSLLLRRNGTTIVKLNTGALRRRFPN